MAYQIQVHINNEQPIVLEVDELPKTSDNAIFGSSPQRRDGKEVDTVLREVNQIYIPWWRVTMVQVLPSESATDVPTFVRE